MVENIPFQILQIGKENLRRLITTIKLTQSKNQLQFNQIKRIIILLHLQLL